MPISTRQLNIRHKQKSYLFFQKEITDCFWDRIEKFMHFRCKKENHTFGFSFLPIY